MYAFWVLYVFSGLTLNIDNTNAKHLELYTVLGEYDNAGFPLSYCLLSTATATDEGKRMKALEAWTSALRDKYGVVPQFVHVDKDMAEIGSSRKTWPGAKIQLCWWHLTMPSVHGQSSGSSGQTFAPLARLILW